MRKIRKQKKMGAKWCTKSIMVCEPTNCHFFQIKILSFLFLHFCLFQYSHACMWSVGFQRVIMNITALFIIWKLEHIWHLFMSQNRWMPREIAASWWSTFFCLLLERESECVWM